MAKELDRGIDATRPRPVYKPAAAQAPTPVAGQRPAGIMTTFQPGAGQTGTLGGMTALPQQVPGAQPGTDPMKDAFRNEQMRMIQALQQAAQGDPNSRAQQQMRDIYQQQRGQISSGISGSRGVAAGAAQEMIQRNQAAADQSYNLDSRALMSQEQMRAQQALLTELGYARDQDLNAEESRQTRFLENQALVDLITRQTASRELEMAEKNRELNIAAARAKASLDYDTQKLDEQRNKQLLEAGATVLEAGQKAYVKNKGAK